MSPLPTFVVIGAQKAGTTSLWTYLRSHPEVFVSDVKEPNYFIEEGTWSLGLDWYKSQFAGAGDKPQIGDVSPGYTMFPIFAGAPPRMAALLPDAKLIYLMRHPIERMRSAWIQSITDGTERRPLGDALLRDSRYLSLSQYALQLEQYLRYYDRSRMLLLRAEDLSRDPAGLVAQVFAFIGVDPSHVPPNVSERANVSEGKVAPRSRVRTALRVVEAVRGRPAALRAAQRVPSWARRALRADEVTLDRDLRERFVVLLEREMERLGPIAGPDFPLWDLRSDDEAPGADAAHGQAGGDDGVE